MSVEGDHAEASSSLFVMEQRTISDSSSSFRRLERWSESTAFHCGSISIDPKKDAHDQEGTILVSEIRVEVSFLSPSSFQAN